MGRYGICMYVCKRYTPISGHSGITLHECMYLCFVKIQYKIIVVEECKACSIPRLQYKLGGTTPPMSY